MSRLSLLHISLIGAGTALVLGLCLFFFLIKPKNEEVEKVKGEVTATQNAGGTESAVSAAKKEHEKTQQVADKTKADWQVNAVRYMPKLNFGPNVNLIHAYESNGYTDPKGRPHGIKDLPTIWGTWVSSWYDAQRAAGVSRPVGMEFPVAAYRPDPNDIASLTHLQFPQDKPWDVTVDCKSFNQAMAHLRRFNDMRSFGMPVINNVSLSGQSPNLQLSYSLILYIIPGTPPPPMDQKITGQGGAGGGGGMGGGFSGPGGMGGSMGGGPGKGSMAPMSGFGK